MTDKNRIIECLNHLGILCDAESNFLLSDIIDDSLLFVSMIVEIEQEFGIEIPDEYFQPDRLISFSDLVEMVNTLSSTK
ncbi:phosphopantetheine-binding protein [Acutalibacter muris]|jgi:acyl carrier protein|uniref:phosphopantetheine-binding protein n=1 Tax=Acutalibacter muris TaxID=1796620 RepID=UPI0026F37E8D|nr:phosphopantetheine-binding protein [Acutalibacter muris]